MFTPKNKYGLTKTALIAIGLALICLALAGSALAEIVPTVAEPSATPPTLTTTDASAPATTDPIMVEPTVTEPPVTTEPEVIAPATAAIEVMEPAIAPAPYPAKYGGTVKYANGDLVDWDEIAGYIDLDESGAIESGEIPNPDHNKLLKVDSGKYTIGQYGLPLNDYLNVRPLVVNCPEETACYGKPVIFKVKVGGVTYNASTNPTQVKWASTASGWPKTQVDLTISISPVTGIKGNAYLENTTDHSGTMVKVKQGSSTIVTKFTDASGKYEVTGLSAGAYTIEFSNTSASWKKVTLPATVGASGLTIMPEVTMYLGDVDQDAAISFSDLLWLSNRIGSKPGQTWWDELGDVNNDNVINILDLLKVKQNIGK